jgi:hypothetical protein
MNTLRTIASPTPDAVRPGQRYRFGQTVDRFQHFVVFEGAIGTVTYVDAHNVRIRMDEFVRGAESCNNEIIYTSEDAILFPGSHTPFEALLTDAAFALQIADDDYPGETPEVADIFSATFARDEDRGTQIRDCDTEVLEALHTDAAVDLIERGVHIATVVHRSVPLASSETVSRWFVTTPSGIVLRDQDGSVRVTSTTDVSDAALVVARETAISLALAAHYLPATSQNAAALVS